MQVPLPAVSLLSTTILDNLGTAIVVFDEHQHVCYLNQMAEMLLAVSANHVLGKPTESWITCHGEVLLDLINATTIGSPIIK